MKYIVDIWNEDTNTWIFNGYHATYKEALDKMNILDEKGFTTSIQHLTDGEYNLLTKTKDI